MRLFRVMVLGVAVTAALSIGLLAQEHTVSKVGIVAKPKVYNGPCPADLRFIATIFVTRHPVFVEYRWERSDGARGERRRIEIRSAGQGVTDTWRLGGRHQRLTVWEKLRVLAPTGISSAPASVRVNCR
jgi:hypothetical protein